MMTTSKNKNMKNPQHRLRDYVRPIIEIVDVESDPILSVSQDPSISIPPMDWDTNGDPTVNNPTMPWGTKKKNFPWTDGGEVNQ